MRSTPTYRTRAAVSVVIVGAALTVSVGCSVPFLRPPRPAGPTSEDFYQQGMNAYRAGDTDAAIQSLTEATRRNPNHAAAHSALGDLYKQAGDHAAAATEFEAVARLEPEKGDNHHRLALSYHFLNRLREAAASYLRAIRLNPTDWKSSMNLGLAFSALGEHNSAVEYAQRAANLNPNSAVVHANLGVTLDARGNPAEAEAAYRRALEIDPSQTSAAQNLVANLLDQGRPQDAIVVIEPLLARADTPSLRRRYGDALAQAGRDGDAIREYREALKRDERYYPAMNGLGAMLIKQYRDGLLLDDRKRDEAILLWRDSLRANPNQPKVQAQLNLWQPNVR